MSYSYEQLDQVLSALEQRELRSLQWGFVEGVVGEAELHDLIAHELGDDADPEEVTEELVELALILERRQSNGTYAYRSRFAEGVRLLSTLRQTFPDRHWSTAAGLVSDYRVAARPRSFPRRDIAVSEVIKTLSKAPKWTPFHTKLVSTLLKPGYQLAAFQVRAASEILGKVGKEAGVVVSAGTGSGKTLSFYLPALVEIGALVRPGEYWVKAVALYPRVELLKDQFSEACRLARNLIPALAEGGGRPLRLGALFGLVPYDPDVRSIEGCEWEKIKGGNAYVCPFLVCPTCQGAMAWLKQDILQKKERLVCQNPDCHDTVSGDEVALTRQSLRREAPDVLFTTTETLNRRLSDRSMRHLFGVATKAGRKLRLVLLDEVHTYSGATGAQTALLLRRWRHALATPIRFVGLSATLNEAQRFFGELVGLDPAVVVEAKPNPEAGELIFKSMVYDLILRGNPASQTALLSTSIQASFLLTRLMDPRADSVVKTKSRGHVGNRLFVFTDDLDVTNRLFDSLRDAEAYSIFGKEDPKRKPLAWLRDPAEADAAADRAGQSWWAVKKIGWHPEERLTLARTSSQDKGVHATSDIIVATAALEVGFNDTTVGSVLQHKSPHDMASYLQRKGRAGRTPIMRPWMVTVLSDYGRDRTTYQAYEQLFDPVLTPQRLPVRNRHILRMQAVFSLLEWLAEEANSGWIWAVLNGPANKDWAQAQQSVLDKLEALLTDEEGRLIGDLSEHLRAALALENDDQLWSLLWEPPRSIMLDVIPTLVRRLKTGWALHPALQQPGQTADIMAAGKGVHPLPDFVPPSLFSPLNVPDVTIFVPPAYKGAEERVETMPIVQALRQLVPGRITRRFAPERGGLYHWIAVPKESGTHQLPISQYTEQYEYVTNVEADVNGERQSVALYRPWAIRLTSVSDKEVNPTSNANLLWRFDLLVPDGATTVNTTSDPRWREIVDGAGFFLHAFRTPLTLRRFALDADTTLRLPGGGGDVNVQTQFVTADGKPAAIGFEQSVDALRLRVCIPALKVLVERAGRSPHVPSWRSAYFRDKIMNDPALQEGANYFQRDWLYQIYLSAVLVSAAKTESTLAEACVQLANGHSPLVYRDVIDSLFRIDPHAEDDQADDKQGGEGNARRPTLRDSLIGLLDTPAIAERLHHLAIVLWQPELEDWGHWLAERLCESVAEACLQACQWVVPQFVTEDSLLADVEPLSCSVMDEGFVADVWISEASLGGVGAMEAIADAVIDRPRNLFSALDACLAPSDLEITAASLNTVVRLTQEDPEVAGALQAVRDQERHADHQAHFRSLIGLLARKGVAVDASLSIALHQRLLRGGTDTSSDRLLYDLLAYWKELQHTLQVAIDLRVFCYLAMARTDLAARIEGMIEANTSTVPTRGDAVATLAGLLWAQPDQQRSRVLQSYSPFHQPGWTDPALVRDLLVGDQVTVVDYDAPGWHDELHRALGIAGIARLVCARHREDALQRDLFALLAEPVNVDFLQFFLAIEQLQRNEQATTITFAIKEIV